MGTTPFRGNVEKGAHQIIVSRSGYEDQVRKVAITPGKVHKLNVSLQESQVGIIKIRGASATGARVKVDDTTVCPSAPCRLEAPVGERVITVTKKDMKPLTRRLMVQKLTETELRIDLQPTPSRADAYWQFVFAAGFGTGAYFLYTEADKREEKAMNEDDKKTADFMRYGSYGAAGISGLLLIRGVYYLFRDKGAPSSARITTRNLAWRPLVGSDVAGVQGLFIF